MTKYQVFRKIQASTVGADGGTAFVFEPLGVFEGHDPQDAVEAAIVASDDPKEYATHSFAVTANGSWRELTPTGVAVETKVKFA